MEHHRSHQIAGADQQDINDPLDRIERISGGRGKIKHIGNTVFKAAQDKGRNTGKDQKVLWQRLFILVAPEVIYGDIDKNAAQSA